VTLHTNRAAQLSYNRRKEAHHLKAKSKLEDELKKLGLRIRPRTVTPADPQKPGHIVFDDLGNAVYEWAREDLAQDGEDAERARRRALAHPGLSLMY
jgi:hypothetical protein